MIFIFLEMLWILSALYIKGCNGQSQSPIDIPRPPASPAAETTPLVMTNYDKVWSVLSSSPSRDPSHGDRDR